MTNHEFLMSLLTASTLGEALAAVDDYCELTAGAEYVPVGGLENNRGPMEVSTDPGRALVERITNGFDAVLELQHRIHGGKPDCRTPREAASAWLGVPTDGLSKATTGQRQELASLVTVTLQDGDGKNARILDVRDFGMGLTGEEMPTTILSLNASNKMTKHYLAGAYGQGGSSTYIASALTLIASRAQGSDTISFTVVRYQDLPPDTYKTGHYVYLVVVDKVPTTLAQGIDFLGGTLVRHFGYQLSSYTSPLGPSSVYGLLNQTLFDPVLPIWLNNKVHGWRRVIKGSRNALNGAVDDGDDGKGPSLSHHIPMLYIPMDDFGQIGVEYWLLAQPERANKRPTQAFVNPARPILLTLNGQAQAELSSALIRKDAELPYLNYRLIVHVDCNTLTPAALRQLFVSNREAARSGALLQMIQTELVRLLRSDDELVRLNSEARSATMKERDEAAILDARKQVAKLLHLQGFDVADTPAAAIGKGGKEDTDKVIHPRTPPAPPQPIELHEPPTYIKIVWPKETIPFYAEQRRYVRIETDAASKYHDPTDRQHSRINFIVSNGIVDFRASTPLRGGRLRALFECLPSAKVASKGRIRVELSIPGQPVLSDERESEIIEAPSPKEKDKAAIRLPQIDYQPVAYGEEAWETLGWPDDVNEVACSGENDQGMHRVHYSTDFPPFKQRFEKLEKRNPQLAKTFENRYAIYLVVHSLLYQEQQDDQVEVDDEVREKFERQERIRAATLAAIWTERETRYAEASGASLEIEEA
ncbi:hypothetical protein EPN52_09675 [bacterium]|nr:MAG: hypothetical protein EPN52_09675 [bacterium]